MYSFLIILLTIDSFVLVAVVLMQAGAGGGMAASFGGASSSSGGTIFGTRQAGNLLTKATWWSAGIFLTLAFMLSLASTRTTQPKSILDAAFPNQGAPTPVQSPAANLPVTPIQTAPATPPAAPPTTKKP